MLVPLHQLGLVPTGNLTSDASALHSYFPGRYVIMLYAQPDNFSPPANLSQPNAGVAVFNLPNYVQVRACS